MRTFTDTEWAKAAKDLALRIARVNVWGELSWPDEMMTRLGVTEPCDSDDITQAENRLAMMLLHELVVRDSWEQK